MKKYNLGRMNRKEAEESIKNSKAVLFPMGSTEQHGYHLPLATDNIVAEYICEQLSKKCDLPYLPVLNYGQVWSAKGLPGTISLSEKTYILVVKEIVKALIDLGAKNVILFSGHTGNILPNRNAVRELMDEYNYRNVYHLSYFDVAKYSKGIIESPPWNGKTFHAAELETAIMLYIDPSYVNMSKAVREYPEIPSDIEFRPRPWIELSESGVWGDATLATAEKGEKFLNNWILGMVNFIENQLK